jgi:hypothetical protein
MNGYSGTGCFPKEQMKVKESEVSWEEKCLQVLALLLMVLRGTRYGRTTSVVSIIVDR